MDARRQKIIGQRKVCRPWAVVLAIALVALAVGSGLAAPAPVDAPSRDCA
jgi:hypothetical protein